MAIAVRPHLLVILLAHHRGQLPQVKHAERLRVGSDAAIAKALHLQCKRRIGERERESDTMRAIRNQSTLHAARGRNEDAVPTTGTTPAPHSCLCDS